MILSSYRASDLIHILYSTIFLALCYTKVNCFQIQPHHNLPLPFHWCASGTSLLVTKRFPAWLCRKNCNREKSLCLCRRINLTSRPSAMNSSDEPTSNNSNDKLDIEDLYRQAMEEDAEWFQTFVLPNLANAAATSEGQNFIKFTDNDPTELQANESSNEENDKVNTITPQDLRSIREEEVSSRNNKSLRERSKSTASLYDQYEEKEAPPRSQRNDRFVQQKRSIVGNGSQPVQRRNKLDSEGASFLNRGIDNRESKRASNTGKQQRKQKNHNEELPGTRFWPGTNPFKEALRSEMYLRASILDLFGKRFRSLKEPLKTEGRWRYQLYSSWLKMLKNGIGDPVFSLNYEDEQPRNEYYQSPRSERTRRRNTRKETIMEERSTSGSISNREQETAMRGNRRSANGSRTNARRDRGVDYSSLDDSPDSW